MNISLLKFRKKENLEDILMQGYKEELSYFLERIIEKGHYKSFKKFISTIYISESFAFYLAEHSVLNRKLLFLKLIKQHSILDLSYLDCYLFVRAYERNFLEIAWYIMQDKKVNDFVKFRHKDCYNLLFDMFNIQNVIKNF